MNKNLGFKKLTKENWLDSDQMNSCLVRLSSEDGKFHTVTGEQRTNEVLQIQLKDIVPLELHKLFEVARGTIIYGHFFYPLYTLGAEQLFRVAEAAASLRCKEMGVSKSNKVTFNKKIEFLISKSIISLDEEQTWKLIRTLRNSASHPKNQTIFMPADAICMIYIVAEAINSLYSREG